MAQSVTAQLDEVIAEASTDKAWEHMEWMSREVPTRISGWEPAKRHADYLTDELTSYGFAAHQDVFPGLVAYPRPGKLIITSAVEQVIEGYTFAHSISTPPEGLEGELLYVGAGGEADYEGKDARGKIVLAELSYSPPRPEKTRIATANGAIGLILINWGDDDNPSIPQGTVKPVWGNPTVDNIHMMPNLPAIGIARLQGVPIRELCKQGSVRATIVSDADRLWKTLHQPHARLGAGSEPHFLLLADHMDSWGGGATDNTSGNAVTLEVARVLANHKSELRRDIQVAFWQAHENGIMEGSTWFVDHYWDEIDRGMIGYINIDSSGMKYATQYEATLSPEFWTMHEESMQAALGYVTPPKRLEKTGDQSFFGVGVPAISGRMEFSKELLERWHGAILGPWYQSTDDTMDVADKDVLAQDIRISMAYAWTLATRPVLPYDFRHNARILREALEGYAAATDDTLGLDVTVELAKGFEAKAAGVYARANELQARFAAGESGGSLDDDAAALNDTMRTISRTVIPVLGSVVGRYGQDTYGLSALKRWIPSLALVSVLKDQDPLSGDHALWWGKLVRERNRVTDAVRELNELAAAAE
ncbi:MAG: M28 family metallopeptidase [Thermomicrobiales bacterium]|nr:M28 family metallopeptidase [Thermomicrobiales bacterium]